MDKFNKATIGHIGDEVENTQIAKYVLAIETRLNEITLQRYLNSFPILLQFLRHYSKE